MQPEEEITALRTGLLEMVQEHLTPAALRHGYSEVPLETAIKWQPLVLVLGNYSSGKSTLINELLGARIQATGQAPTDDSFTVIAGDEESATEGPVRVLEERDGAHLLGDPAFPFSVLKRHGQRFAAHFRLKRVNAPFLRHLALVDTPGMLDSVTERDRGYSYQEVLGDLAELADLVLVLFDPHKAGTVREAYTSLRETLPARTFDDRVLLVLNRVDECASLPDLLRVYGTLCWNLSQMTGRKDIPPIWLTWAQPTEPPGGAQGFLSYLDNQRDALREAILTAPRRRLDHLARFVENHAERLSHHLEALVRYGRQARRGRMKRWLIGMLPALAAAGGTVYGVLHYLPATEPVLLALAGGLGAAAVLAIWGWLVMGRLEARFHRRQQARLDDLTELSSQARRDSWQAIRPLLQEQLQRCGGRIAVREAVRDGRAVHRLLTQGCPEVREALKAMEPSTSYSKEVTAEQA